MAVHGAGCIRPVPVPDLPPAVRYVIPGLPAIRQWLSYQVCPPSTNIYTVAARNAPANAVIEFMANYCSSSYRRLIVSEIMGSRPGGRVLSIRIMGNGNRY